MVVTKSNGTDFAKACGVFDDALTQDNMRHRGATPLARAVTSAKKGNLMMRGRGTGKIEVISLS